MFRIMRMWTWGSLLVADSVWGQQPDRVFVAGTVTDVNGGYVPAAMVVNQSGLGGGMFVDANGAFVVAAQPGDTLAIGAIGFHTRNWVVPPEAPADEVQIQLRRLSVQVGIAEIVAPRELREILRDIESLGYDEKDYRVSSVDALSSPITFLYQMFSREEQSKREVARMENEDRRRNLLRELFVKYVDYDIIDLEEPEFDAFIAFCDPGDEMLQTWSQYEFILYVKQRFRLFATLPSRLDEGDYQYHLD